jgi:hypothetical protein
MQLEKAQYKVKVHTSGAFSQLSRFLVVLFASTVSLAPTATVLPQQLGQTVGQAQDASRAHASGVQIVTLI